MRIWKLVFQKIYDAVLFLCKLLLIAEVLITSMAVAGRYISFIPDPAWSEEVVLTLMIYMGLVSAALAIHRQAHIRMTALDGCLPPKLVQMLDILGDLLILGFAILLLAEGFPYALTVGSKSTYVSMPWLSKFWLYFSVPLAGAVMALFQVEILVKHVRILMGKGEEAA